jgi:crossover junction endodeoxyribonuclease RusA
LSIKLELPLPPSVNAYWRTVPTKGGFSITKISRAGRVYRLAIEAYCASLGVKLGEGAIKAKIAFYFPDFRQRDIDNYFKGLFDSLAHAGVIKNDSLICRMYVEKWVDVEKKGYLTIDLSIDDNSYYMHSGAWCKEGRASLPSSSYKKPDPYGRQANNSQRNRILAE